MCLLSMLALACSGSIDNRPIRDVDDGAPPPQIAPGGTQATASPANQPGGARAAAATGDPSCAQPRALVAPRMWLLTEAQRRNALRDLLGADQAAGPEVASAPSSHSAERRFSAVAAQEHVTTTEAAVARAVGAEPQRLTGCAAGPAEDACAVEFVRRFAARAFRRPLRNEEISDLQRVYDGSKPDGAAAALATSLEAVLQAPSFLYRVEVGGARPDGTRQLDAYESAAALSFYLRDSIPDPALWTAATAGRLHDDADLAREVDRLLAEPAVQQHLVSLSLELTPSAKLGETDKDPKLFPDFEATRGSLRREAELFMDDLIWKTPAGGLTTLLMSSRTFVDKRLAALYGVSLPATAGSGFAAVELPAGQRAGLATHAGTMAALSRPEQTSVVHRGLWAWTALLCQPALPPPPVDAVDASAATTKNLVGERALSLFRQETAACSPCHGLIDPIGLLFERYDPIGRYRADPPGGAPPPADLSAVVPGAPKVTDAVGLARLLSGAAQPALCLARAAVEQAIGAQVSETASCTIAALSEALGGSGGLRAMYRTLALSPALRTR